MYDLLLLNLKVGNICFNSSVMQKVRAWKTRSPNDLAQTNKEGTSKYIRCPPEKIIMPCLWPCSKCNISTKYCNP